MDLEKTLSVTLISLFSDAEITLSESFANRSVEFYEAVPTRLLETSEENTDMINSWVANKTNNKIQRLVDSVSPSTQLMLLNAVSFKGQWRCFSLCVSASTWSKFIDFTGVSIRSVEGQVWFETQEELFQKTEWWPGVSAGPLPRSLPTDHDPWPWPQGLGN